VEASNFCYSDGVLKKIAVLVAFLLVSLVSAQTVGALEVDVSNGRILIFRDAVLGDSDQKPSTKELARPQERERLLSRERQNVRVEKSGERTEIELRSAERQVNLSETITKNKVEQIEQLETNRLEMKFEPGIKQEAAREEIRQEKREAMKTVQQERAERTKENDKVLLETRDVGERHELRLKSREAEARLPVGAQFELNTETNEVTLITPSGGQKTLNHLPDQAIERMQAAGIFSGSVLSPDSVAVEVNTDTQQLEYHQKVRITKRLLGLFKRDIDSEVVLNDETGEIREEQQATGFAKFLNSLSF